MSPADASRFGVTDQDRVEVAVGSHDRWLIFGDVVVSVSPDYRLELHLDTDEADAAGLRPGETGLLLTSTGGELTAEILGLPGARGARPVRS